ncbi:unnamed protein product [Mytilus coruscus]|uniref:Endonuclease/exonuclease/phosphatase domain-containing protein n=1 Tax=Mytilus coruscus TaxID=42192 RepID=A0A6J8F0C1_MYTCO|nr:unnamed protein product [Mytilus coruscus]
MEPIPLLYITGILMNANGCRPKKLKVGGMEIRSKRKDIRQQVIRDNNPDIIFIQESDIVLRNICTWSFPHRCYQSIGGQKAGIIFDALTFTECTAEHPQERIRQIYEYRKFTLNENLSSASLLDRMQAVILQTKGPCIRKFLFVSWHGPHKLERNLKIKMLKDLKYLVSLYLLENDIPVVIGGDFNLDLSKENLFQRPFPPVFDPHVIPNAQFVLCDYLKLDHRPKKIDYIITSRTLTNVSCKPIDVWEHLLVKYPSLPLAYHTAVLDHDSLSVQFPI